MKLKGGGAALKRKYRFLIMLVILALTAVMPACGFVDKLRAKNSLNEGVRDFNNSKFEIAQQKFEYALQLNPDNANAQLFYARALNARFEQKQNTEFGLKTIQAYDNIIQRNHDTPKAVDQALAFEAKAYDELAGIDSSKSQEYKDKGRAALLKRADLSTATNQTKAAVYYTIGREYWQQAYNLSKVYIKMVGGTPQVQPIPVETSDKMRPMLQQGHEYLEKALSFDPGYADAYSINKLLYLQDRYIEPNQAKKAQIDVEIKKADENAKKYYEQQKEAAAQAAQAQ
jgi:tetratricopeptide (TPR) repeat protein